MRGTYAVRAASFCALLPALALAPLQAPAQTAPAVTTPAFQQPTPIVPTSGWPATQLLNPASSFSTRATPEVSAGPLPPKFLLSGAVDLAEGYTSNAQGTSEGKGDTFTRGQLDLGLHYDSLRIKADAHSTTSGYYYSKIHDANQLTNNLNLTSSAELLPDHLFFFVNGFATPISQSHVGAIAAAQGVPLLPSSSNNQTYGYNAAPVFKMRFGDFAMSQSSVNVSQLFVTPTSASTSTTDPNLAALGLTPLGDTTSLSATERLTSGTSFGRLRWDLTASYANIDQTTQTLQQRTVTAEFAYALTQAFAPLVVVGYDRFESSTPLSQDLPAPVALGGFRYGGPKVNFVAAAGVAHGSPTIIGNLSWDLTPRTQIVGSLTDTISTSAANILNNLATLATSAQGVFSSAQSFYWQSAAQALNPQFATASLIPVNGFALDNSVYHERQAQLAFHLNQDRTQYGVSAFADVRDRLNVITANIPTRSTSFGAQFTVSRQLRRDLTGSAGASYSLTNQFGGNQRAFTANAGLTYNLAKNVDTYLTAYYLRQTGEEAINDPSITGPPSTAVVIVGIRHRLGSGGY